MADDTVERLTVLIEANTKQYANAMAKLEKDTQRAINNSTKAVGKLNLSLGSLGEAAKKAAGVLGFGASALVSGVQKAIGDLADLGDAADRAAVSAQKLQVVQYALEKAGGSAEDATGALVKFNAVLGQAQTKDDGRAGRRLPQARRCRRGCLRQDARHRGGARRCLLEPCRDRRAGPARRPRLQALRRGRRTEHGGDALRGHARPHRRGQAGRLVHPEADRRQAEGPRANL